MKFEEEPDISLDKVYFKKIHSFMQFVNILNYSNNIPIKSITLSDKYNGQKMKVFVGHGNNRYLILALLKRRFWFEIVNKITSETKFIWTQNSIKDVHSIQRRKKDCKCQTQTKEKDEENPERKDSP